MQYNPFSLEGKKIFVTGASSGIGKAIAVECSRMGATLLISGRNKERLQNTYHLLADDATARHEYLVADLESEADVNRLIGNLPQLDGIVHCAGLTKIQPFQFINETTLSQVMNVNYTAPVLMTSKLVKLKKLNKNSSIVFISSMVGNYCAIYGNSVYAASKGAVNGMIKGMALDLAPKGIRVNSVNPGMIDTEILSEGVITEEQLEEDKKRYPLKRHGKPEEVAYVVIYLLSDAAAWVTGSKFLIDGGYTLL